MTEIKHAFFHEILNDDDSIDKSTLTELFNTFNLTRDLTASTQIIQQALIVYEVASKINGLPYDLQNEYDNICTQLKLVTNTDSFKNSNPSINSPSNELDGRMIKYPISALLCQPTAQRNETQKDKDKKYLLNLLTFMLLEMKRKLPSIKSIIIDNAAMLLRKYISRKFILKQGIGTNLPNFNQMGILLQKLKENNLINFEPQFITAWYSVYDLIATTKYGDMGRKAPFELSNNTKINPYILFVDDVSIAVEDALTEVVEIKSINKEISAQTKHSSYLYGSQLSIPEKMHLPFKSNSLSANETKLLVGFITEQLGKVNDAPGSILVALTLLTSKKLDYCQNLKIYNNKNITSIDDDYIDLELGVLVRNSTKMPNSFMPNKLDAPFLNDFQPYVCLPLPTEILIALKQVYSEPNCNGLPLGKLKHFDSAIKDVTTLLNHCAEATNIYRKITPAACRAVLFEKFNHKFDEAYAGLALANTEYGTTTPLYYISAPVDKIANDYADIVKNLGFSYDDIQPSSPRSTCFTGSQMTINIEEVGSVFAKRRLELIASIEEENLSDKDIITRFNLFSCYTTLLLLAGTGHRPRAEFGFVKFTIDEEAGYILLSDKVHHLESSCRIIPLCETVKMQLNSYRIFTKITAKLLKSQAPELAEKLALIYSEYDHEQPYLCVINDKEVGPIGTTNVEAYLAAEMSLPLNLFRHFWSSEIRASGEYKHLKSILGHVGGGEHMLSNYSCSSISDIKIMATPIENLLNKIGLLPIDIKPPRGICVQTRINPKVINYIPSYLQNVRNISRKEKLFWVGGLVKPLIKHLKNDETFEETKKTLINQALSANATNIKVHERLYLMNRYIDKIHKNSSWIGLQDSFTDLEMGNDVIHVMRQSKKLHQAIHRWIEKKVITTDATNIQLVKVWLSLIVHSKMNVPLTKGNLLKIIQMPFLESGICFFELDNHNDSPVRVIIDSYTILLLQKHSNYKNSSTSISSLNRHFESAIDQILSGIITRKEFPNIKLKNVDELAIFLSRSRDDMSCSLTHAYLNNKFNTSCLPPEKLTRWLSNRPLLINKNAELIENNGLIGDYETEYFKKADYDFSLRLIKELGSVLNAHALEKSSRVKIKKLLISTWAKYIGCSEDVDINTLIQKSEKIEDVVIAVIVWLIEVSIRPGRQKRKLTALGTVRSYLSITAKPLLEHAHDTSFLSLDADEYEEIYSQTLDSRTKKSRIHRAGILRNFHSFLQQRFDVNTLDWFEVEPNINKSHLPSDANIISMREYQETLELLSHDTDLDEYNRNINQIILILCYRAGLRTGEACFLHIGDIDTTDWIIHVKSCYSHRLKTRTSNRRIPITLFLSDSEKTFIIEHIETVKHYYPDNDSIWLFSDKTNIHCAKSLQLNLNRIREALRLVSGDLTLKLKHARHSFPNYLMLLMKMSFYSTSVNNEIKSWSRTHDLKSFSNSVRELFIGNDFEKEKIMHVIALAMGHVSPLTTVVNYIHTLDILLAAENEQCIYQSVSINELTKLTAFSGTNCHKIVAREYAKNGVRGYQAIKDRLLKSWQGVQRVDVSIANSDIELRSLKVKLPQQIIREFNDIEKVIRLKESSLTTLDITKKLHLDFSFTHDVIDSALDIKLKTGYSGIRLNANSEFLLFETNARNYTTYCKFIRQDAFQLLISKVAEQSKCYELLEKTSQFWLENYTKKGLLVDVAQAEEFIQFLRKIDYRHHLSDECVEKTKYGKRKGVLLKYLPANSPNRLKTDNRIQHLLFLLTLWIDVNNPSRKEAV